MISNRTYRGQVPRIAFGILALIIVTVAFTGSASAANHSSKNIGYVNYDDSGFTGSSFPSGNIFATSVVNGPAPTSFTNDSVTYNNMTFTPLKKADLSSATLANYDTLILFEICDISTSLSSAQHDAIIAYLAAGNKILLFDADRCAPGFGGAGNADYSWFTYPFTTSNPGPQGASGTLTIVENSTLTSGLASDPFNSDELGDANTATTNDTHWFGAANTTNALGNKGYFLAYANNSGLIIYDGADYWYTGGSTKSLTDLFLNELNQQYNPDQLPSSIPIAPTVSITANPATHNMNVSTNFTFTANPVGSWGNNISYSWSTTYDKCFTTAPVFTGQSISEYLDVACGNATISVAAEDEKNNTAHDTYLVTVHENATPIPPPASTFNISGFKINNATGNGVQGWNITLMNSTMQKSILTGADGSYIFMNLVNGTYNIAEENKTGWTSVSPMSQQITINGADKNANFTNQPPPSSTVTPVLTTIIVSPPTAMLNITETQPFTATALDQNNTPMPGINISWTISNSTVGSVTPLFTVTGMGGNASTTFTASAAGTTTVTATNGTVFGSAAVTVTKPTSLPITNPVVITLKVSPSGAGIATITSPIGTTTTSTSTQITISSGSKVTFKVTPNDGYRFDRFVDEWNGKTETTSLNPWTDTMVSNDVVTAVLVPTPTPTGCELSNTFYPGIMWSEKEDKIHLIVTAMGLDSKLRESYMNTGTLDGAFHVWLAKKGIKTQQNYLKTDEGDGNYPIAFAHSGGTRTLISKIEDGKVGKVRARYVVLAAPALIEQEELEKLVEEHKICLLYTSPSPRD